MKNLMRHRLALGVLMAFVLVLGVQSIADALTFGTTRRGDLATVGINTDFTITFYVTLGSNTTPARNNAGDLISAPTSGNGVRIDSGGYPVTDITVNGQSRAYRNFETQPTAPTGGTFVIDPRPRLSTDSPGPAGSPSGPYHISGSNIVDSAGKPVYVQTGTGDTATPWQYTTARSSLGTPAAQITNDARYHYNDERVNIAVTGANIIKVGSASITATNDLTLRETVENSTDARANTDPKTRLTSSVTLTLRATAPEVVEIDITDTTPAHDRPGTEAPQQDFTVYVVSPQSAVLATGATAFATGNDGVEFAFDGEHRQINTYFSFTPTDDAPVHYSVEGSGRIYVRIDSNRQTSPTSSLSTSSSAPVYLDANRGTSKVTVWVSGTTPRSAIFIFQGANPSQFPSMEITQGDGQTGAIGGRLEDYLEVKVTDGNNRPLSGVAVGFSDPDVTTDSRFIPVSGTRVYVNSTDGLVTASADIDSLNGVTFPAKSSKPDPANAIFVQTDNAGLARVYYQLSATAGDYQVTAALTGSPTDVEQIFRPTASSGTRKASLEIVSGDGQSAGKGDPLPNPLVVIVRSTAGHRIAGVSIEFETTAGLLESSTSSGQEITVTTGSDGTASVTYNVGQVAGARSVIAEVTDEQDTAVEYDFVIERVEFRINGGGSSTPTNQSARLTVSVSGTGASRTVEVAAFDARGILRNGVVVSLSASGGSLSPTSVTTGSSSTGRAQSTLTLPSSGSVTITASADGYQTGTRTVTVQAAPDALEKVSGDDQTGAPGTVLASAFVVRLEDRNNNPIPQQTVTFEVTGGGGSLSSTSVTTNSSGQASTRLTLGSSAGTNTVTASATGVPTVTFTATAASAANRLEISDGDNQQGELNAFLADALVVRLLDASGAPVQGRTIEFWVSEGSGTFSPNRRVLTDSQGLAEVDFRPRSHGTIEVEASVRGIDTISPVTFTISGGTPPDALVYISGNNQSGKPGTKLANPFVVEVIDEDDEPLSGVTVTFAVTAGGGSVSPTSATTRNNGRAQTTLTLGEAIGDNTVVARVSGLTDRVTFKARTGAQVLVNAAARPPMYWVDGTNGTLHRLVDAEVEDLATSAEGAMNIAIDSTNGYIYWTAETAANKGVIRRAGLNGRGVQTLKTVSVMPTGIAIDAAGGTVYWTNARGNILSMPVSGGKVTNVLRNLSSPGPIVLSNGVLYWGEATGSVRKMSVTAKPKMPVNLATGLGEPLAIVIAKGKVYWIERGGGGSGKLQRVNTSGQNIQQLKSFASGVPIGLTADSSENKLYWTKRTGKIQRSNFAGRFVKDIVTGLPNPGSIALGDPASVSTTPAAQGNPQTNTQQTNTQQQNNQQASDTSKYDVNGDGAVDNIDLTLVAIALGTSNPTYDVNGDGLVDAKDVRAVSDAISDAAAAPALEIDLKAMDIDFNRVQEQIEMLLAAGDISIEGQRVLLYLQHLLASARPDETVLLANYPNPFNPETWIPYELATDTDVTLTIYNAQGVVVRVLPLGQQSAGYYTSRSRAAYWNGQNSQGEQVASGVYFYQLETDDMSALRKMVILK